jgi:hypothetical protein
MMLKKILQAERKYQEGAENGIMINLTNCTHHIDFGRSNYGRSDEWDT